MSASIHHKSEEGMCLSSALPLTEHFINTGSRTERKILQEHLGQVEMEMMVTILFHWFDMAK